MDTATTRTTVDEYIRAYPKDVQARLRAIRQTIKEIAPQAKEKISYQMPTFYTTRGNLVYFAAFKNHIGLYGSTSSATEALAKALSAYKVTKGSIQFPSDKPLPLPLIRKIVKLRLKEQRERTSKK